MVDFLYYTPAIKAVPPKETALFYFFINASRTDNARAASFSFFSLFFTLSGKAVDIDDDGCLLVDTGREVRRVMAGDVSIRPADAPIPQR